MAAPRDWRRYAKYAAKYRRAYREQLWLQGLCIDCKAPTGLSWRRRCPSCSARNTRSTQAWRARRAAEALARDELQRQGELQQP